MEYFIYVVSIGGGLGPNVWDDEIVIRAENFRAALDDIEANYLPHDATIHAI